MDNRHFMEINKTVFEAAFERNGKCFLLIDASLRKYQSDDSLYKIMESHSIHSIKFNKKELHGALPLYLVPPDFKIKQDVELFNYSIRHALTELDLGRINAGEGRSVCAWISTELNREQLSESISGMIIQPLQSGNDILVRYFDPSVFGLLLSILDNWQSQQLLRDINFWCYIDGDGNAQVINGGGEQTKKLNYSLGLSEDDLSKINNILVINRVLRLYRKNKSVKTLSEQQVAELLHPAILFFYSTFSAVDDGVADFCLDVLSARWPFYQGVLFGQHILDKRNKHLNGYIDLKSMVEIDMWKKIMLLA